MYLIVEDFTQGFVSLLPGKSCFIFCEVDHHYKEFTCRALCKHNEGELVVQLFLHNVPFD